MTETEERKLLEKYRSWLRVVAADLLRGRPPHLIDDLASEGWIAIWKAMHENRNVDKKAPLDWWLKRQAKLRMTRMIRDWFEPMKQRQHTWVEDVTDYVDLPALLPDIEIAYHRGEIYQALNILSPREREYVVMRYLLAQTPAELTAHFGYEPTALWRTARPKLARELAYLGREYDLVTAND